MTYVTFHCENLPKKARGRFTRGNTPFLEWREAVSLRDCPYTINLTCLPLGIVS